MAVTALTLNELCALHNLYGKRCGEDVDWITAVDVCALTALGLARRAGAGLEITAEGEAVVSASPEALKRPKLPGLGPSQPGEFDS
jgi:hypothetical protein